MMYLLFFIGTALALTYKNGSVFDSSFVVYFMLFIALFLFDLANNWSHLTALFNTSQPFYDQAFRLLGISALFSLLKAASMALIINFSGRYNNAYKVAKQLSTYAIGSSLGFIAAGLHTGIQKLLPSLEPHWADYTPLGTWLPINAGINAAIMYFIGITLICLLAFVTIAYVTTQGQKRNILGSSLLLLFAFVFTGLQFPDNFALLSMLGLSSSIFFITAYYTVVRFDHALIPLATGSFVILGILRQGILNAHMYTMPIAAGASIVIALLAWAWFQKLNQ